MFEFLGHGRPIIAEHVLEEVGCDKVVIHVDFSYFEDSSDDVPAEG